MPHLAAAAAVAAAVVLVLVSVLVFVLLSVFVELFKFDVEVVDLIYGSVGMNPVRRRLRRTLSEVLCCFTRA